MQTASSPSNPNSSTSPDRRGVSIGILIAVLSILTAIPLHTEQLKPLLHLKPASGPVPREFFGMHIHEPLAKTPWPEAPFGSYRLWDTHTRWADIQPTRDSWNFAQLDKYVEVAGQHHVNLLLTMGMTPQWASSRPLEHDAQQETGLAAPPKDPELWRSYVRQLARRYKGKIQAYELWNEPNDSRYFSGTPEELVQLASIAYREIKVADPSALIVCPSPAPSGGIKWLNRYLAAGGAKYCDIVGYHFYSTKPEDIVHNAKAVQEVAERFGIRAVWNTELGWATPLSPSVDPSAYVSRSFILAWASGLQRSYWYAWDNYSWVGLQLSDKNSRRMNDAGRAYATTESWLEGSTMQSCEATSTRLWTCKLSTRDGSEATIAWTEDSTVIVNLCPGVCTVYSLDGQSRVFRDQAAITVGVAPELIRTDVK